MLKNIKTIAMMGKPGSGKGTQAEMLSKGLGYKLFSSGESFRKLTREGTPLGKKVGSVIDVGGLMPHWFASYMFEREVFHASNDEGIVFEGPGRKLPEAQLFHEIMEWLERPYRAVYLKVDEEVIRERLLKRAATEGRADDNDKAIDFRFEEYEKHTAHSINFFRERGMLIEVDGMRDPEEVEADIMAELKKEDEALS